MTMTRRYERSLVLLLAAAAVVAVALAVLFAVRSGPAPAGPTALPALQAQYIRVVKSVSPSVVQIETGQGLGSGIVFDSKGDIVTNAHVVAGANTFKVTLVDGRQYQGSLVGTYLPDDLAVIKVNAPNLQPASFADSSKLQVGMIAMAVGNPLGLRSSVTDGIVSALGRTVGEPNGATIPNAIQTSAAINPGNSGGALVDLTGKVIGIPTLAATDPQLGGGAAPGIGFAVASNTVTDIARQLISSGKVVNSHRAYLGVRVSTIANGSGVLVGQVVSGTPAAKAGVKQGDVIVSVAGKKTPTTDQLSSVLANLKPGQTVKVGLVHPDGSRSTATVTLGELPGNIP